MSKITRIATTQAKKIGKLVNPKSQTKQYDLPKQLDADTLVKSKKDPKVVDGPGCSSSYSPKPCDSYSMSPYPCGYGDYFCVPN